MPIGAPPTESVGDGMFTAARGFDGVTVYNSLTPPAVEFTHAIPTGAQAKPHASINVGSTNAGSKLDLSATRLTCSKFFKSCSMMPALRQPAARTIHTAISLIFFITKNF